MRTVFRLATESPSPAAQGGRGRAPLLRVLQNTARIARQHAPQVSRNRLIRRSRRIDHVLPRFVFDAEVALGGLARRRTPALALFGLGLRLCRHLGFGLGFHAPILLPPIMNVNTAAPPPRVDTDLEPRPSGSAIRGPQAGERPLPYGRGSNSVPVFKALRDLAEATIDCCRFTG